MKKIITEIVADNSFKKVEILIFFLSKCKSR